MGKEDVLGVLEEVLYRHKFTLHDFGQTSHWHVSCLGPVNVVLWDPYWVFEELEPFWYFTDIVTENDTAQFLFVHVLKDIENLL